MEGVAETDDPERLTSKSDFADQKTKNYIKDVFRSMKDQFLSNLTKDFEEENEKE